MVDFPTPDGSSGTWGDELNELLGISLASSGKIKDGAVFSTSAAPTVDAGVANKLYVDTIVVLSAMTDEDADTDALDAGVTYTATSDGFITAQTQLDTGETIALTVDSVVVQKVTAGTDNVELSVFGAVASAETFIVGMTAETNKVIRWRSIGTLSKPTK